MGENDHMKLIYDFHQTMVDNGFSLVYEGEITHQITKAFTAIAENNMITEAEDSRVKKRVFHVMVECLQNLTKHSEEIQSQEPIKNGTGVFIVGKKEDAYHIITGNPLSNDRIIPLRDLLDNINALDKDGQKKLFTKVLKEGALSDKGGAGLGLIDIARKTGERLDYHFEPVDEKNSFFLLKIKVTRDSDEY
ncbi:MAG: SiaB family protein kinase [Bacteroidetes bacterium]|nr:SiaB family protein kinase [Bacteroidota bacterium]MBU1718855.1 SiaB family protein kinase [Bacteroidota bacterium]